jgi:hypothetical protein
VSYFFLIPRLVLMWNVCGVPYCNDNLFILWLFPAWLDSVSDEISEFQFFQMPNTYSIL